MGSAQSDTAAFCGIGEVEVSNESIVVSSYPFEPSGLFPEKTIRPSDIVEIYVSTNPLSVLLHQRQELIFVPITMKDSLRSFAESNGVRINVRNQNWKEISRPFVDSSYTADDDRCSYEKLLKCGIDIVEVKDLRKEIGSAIKAYKTALGLSHDYPVGLSEVLQAMHAKLRREEFRVFYWKCMEVEMRKNEGPRGTKKIQSE